MTPSKTVCNGCVIALLSLSAVRVEAQTPLKDSLKWGAALSGVGAFDLGTTISWSSRPQASFKVNTCTEKTSYMANADGTANGPKSAVIKGAIVAGLVGALYATKKSHHRIAEVMVKALIGAQAAEWGWAGVSSLRLCR